MVALDAGLVELERELTEARLDARYARAAIGLSRWRLGHETIRRLQHKRDWMIISEFSTAWTERPGSWP